MNFKSLLFLLLITFASGNAQETEERVDKNARLINLAILTLPDHLVSNLPEKDRAGLLKLFSYEGRGRLDYGNGFVDYYRDGAAAWDIPSGDCRFWMKIFRGTDGSTFLLVHNSRPESSGEMTAFFRCDYEFEDVTSEYLPKEVDLSQHLRPQRYSDTVRIAAYEAYTMEDPKYKGHTFHRIGPQTAELIWNGKEFEYREATPTKIPHLDRLKKKP